MSNTYSVPKSDSDNFIEPQIISITNDLTPPETERYSNLTSVLTSGEITSEERKKSLVELGSLMTSEPDKYFSYMSQFVIKVEEKTRPVTEGIQRQDENIPAYNDEQRLALYEYFSDNYPGFKVFVKDIFRRRTLENFPKATESINKIKQDVKDIDSSSKKQDQYFTENKVRDSYIQSLSESEVEGLIEEISGHEKNIKALLQAQSAITRLLAPKKSNAGLYTTLDGYRMITLMSLNKNASIQNKKGYIKSQIYALMILSEARIFSKIPEELKRKI